MARKEMGQVNSCNGPELRQMFAAATLWLKRNARDIDSLNVFPVPDGDTGTNMVLTMKSAMDEAVRCSDSGACAVLQAMAWGGLMGARGNSGVILAQILRGLAQALEGKQFVTARDLAQALDNSSALAYKAVSQPVEGTILTVIRDAAASAQAKVSSDASDLRSVMETLVAEARASVARTPALLPVLHQAGVVDAGGQGLYVLFEGALRHLRGEDADGVSEQPAVAGQVTQPPVQGYCAEFLVQGSGLDAEQIRNRLAQLGESVVVIGDADMVKAHVHAQDPEAVMSYASSLGMLLGVKLDDMAVQHREFIAAQTEGQDSPGVSVVAVASGDGLSRVFSGLGASVVTGGETMNPSVQDLLWATDSVPAQEVIVLPNSPDILPAVAQVRSLTKKQICVVPAKTIPQGIAALFAYNPEADLEPNLEAMESALSGVRTGELTTAVRAMKWGRLKVSKGQAIAFLDGDLVAAGDTRPEALRSLLAQMDVEHSEIITIYYGAEASEAEVEEIAQFIRRRYAEQELEIVTGGQPHYHYIVSVE